MQVKLAQPILLLCDATTDVQMSDINANTCQHANLYLLTVILFIVMYRAPATGTRSLGIVHRQLL